MTSPDSDPVDRDLVRVVDGVLHVRISTERGGNALDPDGLDQGTTALRQVAAGSLDVGAVLLYGPGANFCAGGDVRSFAAAPDRSTFIAALADRFHGLLLALADADTPVVAAVRGWAAGAGMSIVCHSDIAIGGPGTSLRAAYPGIGLSPDGGMTWALPRIVGAARARHLILTDAVITAPDALEMGLLSQVVGSDDDVVPTAVEVATRLAAGPRSALRAARRLLADGATAQLVDQLAAEAASISALAGGREGIEGVDAFVQKRRPDFTAR
ncbi:enoyl-CoA hydratase/isomerase family protein [Williamsia herbipolensis]|uniref:enoyl-CoA hydratase/isomerase family protein n=1 Tax=Williamsia herbipolensis TaxID=1603258 RepID=UPI0005F87613|nr:enoyl-CoA hydratase-related protein [Williamsia herbipolensis]MCX6468640.1 enoyl-CoA hydratase-related protein [Mycobacteriales bacterium]